VLKKYDNLFFSKAKYISLLAVFFFLPDIAHAAAWLMPKGDGQVIGTIQPYKSCSYWDKQSNLQSGTCFYQFSVNAYTEYGVTNNFTFILNPTFLNYSQGSASSPFALGYATIGGRFLIKKKDYDALSFQLLYNQPFKSKNFGNGTSPSSQYTLANEQQYMDVRLLYGVGGKFDTQEYSTWYADVETSYRPYFNGAADEVHIDFMAGWKTYNQRLIFELQELNTFSMHDPKTPQEPNYNLFTVMPNIIFWFKPKVALQIGVKQDFYGWNIGQGTAPFIAMWLKF